MQEHWQSRRNLEHLPLVQPFAAEEADADSNFRILDVLSHELVKPLLDQNSEGCSHKAYYEAARPERVDSYEGRGRWESVSGGVIRWVSRVDEGIRDRKASELEGNLCKDFVRRIC